MLKSWFTRFKRLSAKAAREIATKLDRISCEHARAGSINEHGEDQPDWALSENGDDITGNDMEKLASFETRVDRLYPACLIERDAGGNTQDAALDDPIHDPDVLGKAAARCFKTGGDTNPFVELALRVKFAMTVETISARNVVKYDNPVARTESE